MIQPTQIKRISSMKNIKYLLFTFTILLLFTYCKKETPKIDKPVIEKGEYSPSTNIAISKITSGGRYIVEYGHIWDTIPPIPNNPLGSTIYENTNNSDVIEITSQIQDLIPGKTYFIQAYAIDEFGNSFYGEESIIYDPFNYRTACFTASRTECEIGTCSINFDASCSENATSYKWDFNGDGIFELSGSDKEQVSHTYTSIGSYNVKLKVITAEGIVSDTTQVIRVNDTEDVLPVACFIMSGTECYISNCIITFDASCSFNVINYKWDFDNDGQFEMSGLDKVIVSYTYTSVGTFTAKLEVENINGVVEVTTVNITVFPEISTYPVACFLTNTTIAEVNETVYFDASCSSEDIINYKWDFTGDGVFQQQGSNEILTNYAFTSVGTYTTKLQVESIDGLVDIFEQEIIVNDVLPIIPESCFEVSRSTCEVGDCLIYFDASCSIDAAIYKWDFDDDGFYDEISDNPITNYTFTFADTYMATLQVESIDGSVDDTQQEITVSEPPPARFTVTVIQLKCIQEADAGSEGEYYGYTTVRLNANGINQAAMPGTPPYENPVPAASNKYYMWERGSGSTINLSEGESHLFDESIINYEVSILDINTSQIIVNTFLEEDDFSSTNDFIDDKTDISNLSDLTVGETHYIIQELSGNGSTLELYLNIQRVE